MLTAEAKSFRHKSRLAISLSWIAGFTNVIVLIVAGKTISHQTGNSTQLARALGEFAGGQSSRIPDLLLFAFLVATFWLGAFCSGLLMEYARRNHLSSRYIAPVTLEAILLALLLLAMLAWPAPGDTSVHLFTVTGLAGFAMGLQNATITRISGAVVRTTHLTGVVTDLGLETVQLLAWWRDQRVAGLSAVQIIRATLRHETAYRIALLASIWGSFVLGAMLATLAYGRWGAAVMIAPVLFLTFIVLQSFFKPIAEHSAGSGV